MNEPDTDGQRDGNILVVDDNAANLAAIEAALNDLAVHVVRAPSGDVALRLLLSRDFALILLDVKMPTMDGFETARLIRTRKRSRHTPIIFITAHGRALVVAVVEDNTDVRELMFELLTGWGHRVVVAKDGVSGSELILNQKPHVALVDIGLPELDGYGVARAITLDLRLPDMDGWVVLDQLKHET